LQLTTISEIQTRSQVLTREKVSTCIWS